MSGKQTSNSHRKNGGNKSDRAIKGAPPRTREAATGQTPSDRAPAAAKTARSKPAATSAPRPLTAPAPRRSRPSEEEIARRAFELYQHRGATDGQDLRDWLQAERELAGLAAREQERYR